MAEDVYPTHKQPGSLTVWQPWSALTAYVVDDRVSETVGLVTSYYVCILANTNQNPPNGTYWAVEAPVAGPRYTSYTKHVKDWGDVTLVSVFEDKAVDTNQSADDVPQRWTLKYVGKAEAPTQVLRDFWDSHRRTVAFTFVEPRDIPFTQQEGDIVEGVFFESFEDDGHGVREFQNNYTVKLVKYP